MEGAVPVNDKALAAKLQKVRSTEVKRTRARFSQVVPEHAFSEETLVGIPRDINEEAVRRLCEHPEFPAMARRLAQQGAPDKADNGVIAHALRDGFRLMSGIWSLYLAATPGGLTFSRFDALHQVSGEGGRARTHGLITYLRFLGYIEPDDSGHDGRERRYRPTARMREAFRRYFTESLEAAVALYPEAAPMIALMEDEQAFDDFMVSTGEGLMIAGSLVRLHKGPSFNDFSRRKSGMVMLWTLLLSAPPSLEWPTRAPFPVSIADIARKAGVSRAHVQRLLRDCEANGMMALDGAGNVRVRRVMWLEINTYQALFVICMAACARNTLAKRAARDEARLAVSQAAQPSSATA